MKRIVAGLIFIALLSVIFAKVWPGIAADDEQSNIGRRTP